VCLTSSSRFQIDASFLRGVLRDVKAKTFGRGRLINLSVFFDFYLSSKRDRPLPATV
jgi:hypothetical protein